MASPNLKNVLCLEESVWDSDKGLRDRASVLPALELLERVSAVRFVHRHVATPAEFRHYLEMRRRRMPSFGVIYLAFHGSEKGLAVGEETVGFDELAERLGPIPGAVVHPGSCSVLRGDRTGAERFVGETGARAVTGYGRDVDWLESAAFDQLLLGYLAGYERAGDAFRYLRERHGGFIQHLEWICVGGADANRPASGTAGG